MCARYDQGLVLFILLHQIGTFLAIKTCMSSIPTVQYVSSCPSTEADWVIAGKRKMCSSVGQNCTAPDKFVYHCLVNSYFNATLEVCAPVWKMNGYCPGFNVPTKRIQQMSERDCTKYSHKCPAQYDSSEVYKYPSCFMLNHSNTTKHANEWKILSIILMAVIAVLSVTFGILLVCFQKCRTNDLSKKGKQGELEQFIGNKGKQEDIENNAENKGKQEDIENNVENKVLCTSCRKDKDDHKPDTEEETMEASHDSRPNEASNNINLLTRFIEIRDTCNASPHDSFARSSVRGKRTTTNHQCLSLPLEIISPDNDSAERNALFQSVAKKGQISSQVFPCTNENRDGLSYSMSSLGNHHLPGNYSAREDKNYMYQCINKMSVLYQKDDDTMSDSTEYTSQAKWAPTNKKPKYSRIAN